MFASNQCCVMITIDIHLVGIPVNPPYTLRIVEISCDLVFLGSWRMFVAATLVVSRTFS